MSRIYERGAMIDEKTATIAYTMPAEADPEPGQPDRMQHGCDYMRQPDGGLDFYYNFLDYEWRLGSGELRARCYMDEPSKLSFSVSRETFSRLDRGDVLSFAQRRFDEIATLETDGYRVHWRRVR
jgi:hypothetical protein